MSAGKNNTPIESVKSVDIRVSCRVPLKLKRRLARIAKANGIDESDVVRMALNRVLPQYEQEAA